MKTTKDNYRLPSTRFPLRRNKYDNDEIFHSNQLPVIKFSLRARNNTSNLERMKLASQNCPNYFILSANLTDIQSFVVRFGKSLARRNSRYAIFTEDENISTKTFLTDVMFFTKVINLAIIGMRNIDEALGFESFVNLPESRG